MTDLIQLGTSDLKVSTIGLGSWQGGMKDWGNDYSKTDIIEAIKKSVEYGVNFIDTAELYGNGVSESIIGEALKEIKEPLIIATKVKGENLRYGDVIKSAEQSLKRLNVKEIDLYQIHYPNFFVNLKSTMKAMEHLIKQGKIRNIGVSNFPVSWLKKAELALSGTSLVSNQIRYNMLQRAAESEIVPYCKKHNITVIAWSPLAKGILSGKYDSKNYTIYKSRKMDKLFTVKNLKALEPFLNELSNIGKNYNKSISQVSLNWLISKGVVAIPGAKNSSQAISNAGAMGWRLTDTDLKNIENVIDSINLKEGAYSRLTNWFYKRT